MHSKILILVLLQILVHFLQLSTCGPPALRYNFSSNEAASEIETNAFRRSKRSLPLLAPGDDSFWPGTTIYYSVDSSFNDDDKDNLAKAISNYESKTCIRWVPRTDQAEYLTLIKDPNQSGAASDNCYTPGVAMEARFCPTCTNIGTQIHEMGHALCFGHEQDRNDRDEYLRSEDCTPAPAYDHLNGGHLYDYLSIMHYGCDNCRIPKLPGVERCGSPSDRLSVLDVEKLNTMYKCGGCHSYRFRFPEQIQCDSTSNPMVVGHEPDGQPLYICRAYHAGDIIPGKGSLSGQDCHVGYAEAEHRYTGTTEFEILTNPQHQNFYWTNQSGSSTIPSNAIPGGRTAKGETLYIGRCTMNLEDGQTSLIPGKVHESSPSLMYITFNGEERKCSDFEILVCS